MQLEADLQAAGLNPLLSFQFHIGAIRRLQDERAEAEEKASFNSILVQLEARMGSCGRVSGRCFNSILVQLEVPH